MQIGMCGCLGAVHPTLIATMYFLHHGNSCGPPHRSLPYAPIIPLVHSAEGPTPKPETECISKDATAKTHIPINANGLTSPPFRTGGWPQEKRKGGRVGSGCGVCGRNSSGLQNMLPSVYRTLFALDCRLPGLEFDSVGDPLTKTQMLGQRSLTLVHFTPAARATVQYRMYRSGCVVRGRKTAVVAHVDAE